VPLPSFRREFSSLNVYVPYPNAVPSQVQEEITRPLEEALSTMSHVKRMYSYSDANSSNIFLEFEWGMDIDVLRVEARERVERIRADLPDDVEHIFVQGFKSTDIPVLVLRVSSGSDLSKSYDLIEKKIINPLRQVPGVARVISYGVEKKEISSSSTSTGDGHNVDVGPPGRGGAGRNVSAGRVETVGSFSRVLGDFKSSRNSRTSLSA
jgi:HAE1 family hydrophobic/amphiphilic exporter-1